MTTPQIILVLAILAAAFFCIGGFWAGEWIKRNAAEFRIGEVE